MKTILDKTTRKQLARARKLENERRLQLEQKLQLEAKRRSNRQQIKSEGGSKIPHMDLTRLKTESDTKVEPLEALEATEMKFLKKEVEIKSEPYIKIEED